MMSLRLNPASRLRLRLGTLLDVSRTAQRLTASVVDLLVRLSLAKVFFEPGMFPGSQNINYLDTTWLLIITQVLGPVLLATGFWTRPIACLMLVLTVARLGPGSPQGEHLFSAALFGWYVVQGSGPLSFDRILGKGLGLSPLPLADQAMAAGAWFSRQVGPIYQLALRLWLGTALVGSVRLSAVVPSMTAGILPNLWAGIAAALLVVGLGFPIVTAGLLVFGSAMAIMEPGHGMTLYEPLLLALLGTAGAGRYSLDSLIARHLLRPFPPLDHGARIVIVGAGFGGMACAAALRHERARITLIDRHNYHLFQPLLYQVATGSLSPGDIAAPIRSVFRHYSNLRVLCGTVSGVDATLRHVIVNGYTIPYDSLVLATGATHGYFGHENWAAFAPGLKSVQDATGIRSRILYAFEQAEATDDALARKSL